MRSSLAIVLLIVLGGCALPQQSSRTIAPYEPLQAYITALTPGGPLFHVNRPAYVAMFYISPGSGVSMLYPGFGSGSLSGRAFAGSHFTGTRLNNRGQYIFTRASVLQPRYYFLIASERPLNVSQFGAFSDGLRSRLGSAFASYSAFNTMESIAREVLPSLPDDGSWTSDMYVEWPSVIHSEPGRARVLLDCGGYSMYVAREHVAVVRSTVCDAAQKHEPKEPNDHEPGDPDAETPDGEEGESEEPVVRPRTRNALTNGAASSRGGDLSQSPALRERISSSTQLSAASARNSAWENALSTARAGSSTRVSNDMPPRSYGSASRSPASGASAAPAATRAPAAGSPSSGETGRRSGAATSGGSSGGGDSGRRARPTPSGGN